MLKNPFHKKKSFSQKVGKALHIPSKKTDPKEKFIKKLQQSFFYVALFLAGYIIAKLQMLMK
ncbi:MAG: hypothetical protein OEX81_02035 [Candidatus Pacebacteria bacterium]|nr:hypothetical protein [Candidatus Paceibacterota bacterium]